MRIRLLGPVELRTPDGRTVEVSGAKRCAVLALLGLRLGRSVPVASFFEMLWGDEPPAQARAALQGHIAALRKLLDGSPFTLVTRSPGYLLTGDPQLVDALRFEALISRASTETADAEAAGLLREALDLWHGAPLTNLPDTELRGTMAAQLESARTRALESWAERLLRLGRGAAAIPPLDQSVRSDGLHEPAIALLIRCLHQNGRISEALNVYHHARARLSDELGISPGRLLQAAFDDVLKDRPEPVRASPTQPKAAAPALPRATPAVRRLPRRLPGFVGRTAESLWLDQECGGDRGGSGLAVVVGPAGVGKTTMVVRWAHSVASAFPDGQLFADLHGFDPNHPVDPGDALGRFLRSLGVTESEIPDERTARAALYRTLTRDRRLLVVLDNVRTAEDVGDLLPAGAACATVITSRNTLEDLVVTEGAALLRLGALPAEDARGLLEQLLTPPRVRAEPEAADRLAELCDRLPLALRIAAARLASQPGWTIADLVQELEDERTRLQTLDTQGTLSVRTALSLTIRHLTAEAARLVALLTVHPGPEADTFAAAALLGTGTAEARRALGSLAAHHLLGESTPGRYSRHDLIRLFGAELLSEQPETVRQRATTALLDYYLAAACRSAVLLQPETVRFEPQDGQRQPALPRLADVRAALAWFQAEEPAIRSLVATAADQGEHERAWRLAYLANCLYYGAGQRTDRLACLRSGLRGAQRSGSTEALALMEAATARALNGNGRNDEAYALATRALARTTAADGDVHVHTLTVLAIITAARGGLAEALRLAEEALRLIREEGFREHAAATLSNAAALHGVAGGSERALRYAREAKALLAGHPEATFHLSAMVNEAHALQGLGRPEAAEQAWLEALAACRSAGTLHIHALAERHFAGFLAQSDRRAESLEHLHTAVGLYERLGDTVAVGVLEKRIAALRD